MVRLNLASMTTGLLILSLATFGCGGDEGTEQTPGNEQAAEIRAPTFGEAAEVLLPNDSTLGGVAILVRKGDGSTVPGLFRGPSKLAEEVSGGDWEFHEDSLHARVRLLGPGEELRRRGGGGP